MWGMPISFYLSRSSNVDIDIVQKLVAAYPESLMYGCPDMNISPLHTILMNFHINNMYEVATYMIESSPDSVRLLDKNSFTILHSALTCYSNNLDIRLVDLMLERWPEITRQRNTRPGEYPIHVLCWGSEFDCFPSSREVLSEEKAFAILTKLIRADPSSVQLRGMADEYLPIHLAVDHSPLPFLKAIVESFPEGLKVRCEGDLPLHRAQRCGIENVRYLFDQWPEAIEETPDIIREIEQSSNYTGKEETLSFLRNQRTYVREAKRNIRFDIQDGDGRLALHRALIQRNVSLGSVKLLVQRNLAALQIVDNQGSLPLHYACKCQADIVQYLVESFGDSLNTLDANGNSTLHCACIGGACDVVSYLVQKQNSFVSVRNRDGKIPFQLLTESNVSQSTDFVEATWLLLVAHPETVLQW